MKPKRSHKNRVSFYARFVSSFLIIELALGGSPAWALRPVDAPETGTAAWLQRRLQPPAGQEEAVEAKWKAYASAWMSTQNPSPIPGGGQARFASYGRPGANLPLGLNLRGDRWEFIQALKRNGFDTREKVRAEFTRRLQEVFLRISDEENGWIDREIEEAFRSAGQEESHEARAERIIKETAGWIDQNIRSQVYGHGPLVVSGRGALRIGSEVSAKEWNRIYPVDFVADRVIGPNGFYEDGYSCSDAAVFIAEHLRSEFQKAGIPAVVLVRVGRTSIWAKDFFVVVQLGSSRWIFSGTPEMPTLGASFLRVDDQIVYTPDEWHYLRRSNYITLHSGEGRRLAIPMYWIPLDENHVLSINAGIDPGDGRLVEPRDPDTLDGLNKPFELFFQTSVFRLEPPEDLFGRVVLIRIPKGRLKELRGALRADRQADFLNWLREAREAGVTVKDYFYGNHSVGRIDEADLQNQPFFREMKDAATAHENLLYYLFEALHEWPATWDSAPRTLSGLEENSPADSRSELWLPGADLPAVGLEERKLPADFKYQGISPKVLPDVGQKWDLKNTAYAERLVADRNGAGRRFILKNETDLRGYPVGIRKNYLWRTKNNPVREYLAFKLARALGANVCDVVIPDPEERKIFTDFLGSDANASPDGVYLVRAAQDYQLADEQVKQKDSKRAFTRNFVAALAMRKYDFHYSNLAPLPDAEKVFMMFDGDQCFHLRAIDFSVFLRKFILNYFQWGGHFDGRINPNDLLKFIDPAELRAAIDEFKALDLNRLKGEVEEELRAKSLPTSQLSQIDAYFTLLEYWQRYIGEDALMFFDKLYAYPRLPTLPADPPLVFALGDIHRALSREGTTQFGAGQEEVGTLAERMPDWLRDVIPASEMADLIRAVHDKAIIGDGLIFLIQPELLDPAGKADRFNLETDLIGLNGSIRAALDLPEEADFDLGIDLLTDQNKKTYEGHRIVEVVRDPSGKNRDKPLPFEAIPLVVARAMAAARGQERYRFIIDVTPYLDVQGETLPEVLSELTDLFA